ncbi:hypothetical protein ACFQ1E_08310 [Sphingomonas canadensis]|uniref:Glycerophosphoryl diester phosphodiesterase membrane domain-containing protein n=1 Tax=Sphingomonas canadensis TaxID=1219257 RepID=A0ABW3H498_9SPHN|nr:hypothetical protein [Sphingomonas canadensis]MCW3836040.1 hypothetical protein [Sphingomonas canadensis]
MNRNLSAIFADAAALWRSDADLLARVAAVFFFLPGLAQALFVPMPELAGLEAPEAMPVLAEWLRANIGWLAGQFLMHSLGSCALLVLLLDPARPAVGGAMRIALRRLPGYVVLTLTALLVVLIGMFPLLVPGFYLMGRLFLTGPTYVAEPQKGAIDALVAGIRHSHRNGWMLALVALTVGIIQYLAAGILDAIAQVAGVGAGTSVYLLAPFKLAIAAAGAALALWQVLLSAAAYRLLATAPRHGI